MAKTTTAETTLPLTMEQIKEQQKLLKEQQAALKEAAKKEAEEAKVKAEEDAKAALEAREEAVSNLSSAILDALGGCEPLEIIKAVNATSLIALIEAKEGGDASTLKEAVEALEAAGGVKGPKVHRNGTSEGKEFAASGELTAMQKRILKHLFDTNQPANRQTLTEVANGKTHLTSGRPVTMDGNQLGQRDPAQRHPRSLLGRGFIVEKVIDVDGKKETTFAITKEGKAEAKKL
jgi:hypothetical protein